MTSRDVFHRIQWDPRIDSSQVTIGYQDRFKGVLDMVFDDVRLGKDIPWHRIQNFKFAGRIVWDREGTDELDAILDSPQPSQHGCYRWADSEWAFQSPNPLVPLPEKLSILSLNLLFDLYKEDVPPWSERVERTLELLRAHQADFICLQEVTPPILSSLLEADWIRKTYFSSDGPVGKTVQPYGQVLLSKVPFAGQVFKLQTQKKLLRASFGDDLELHVVHLSSSRSENPKQRRQQELDEVLSRSDSQRPTIIVGDFNEDGLLDLSGYRDAWLDTSPGETGFTFDPFSNPLARKTSRRGRQARFDRLLFPEGWTCLGSQIVGRETPSSDHYALFSEILAPSTQPSVHRSALALLFPAALTTQIQKARELHDKGYQRWMPHINLLYGFVAEEFFEEARQRLQSLLKNTPPFRITLSEVQRFEHKKSTTLWLQPICVPAKALENLQAKIQKLFPECQEQSSRGEHGFTPHLTVATIKKGQAIPRLQFEPIDFEVHELSLISRREDEAFATRCEVRLRGTTLSQCLPDFPNISQAEPKALPKPWFPVGTSALGLQFPWSDRDVVVIGHESPSEAFCELENSRLVQGRVNLCTTQVAGVKWDLQYAHYPRDLPLKPPERLNDEEFELLDPASQRAAQSRRELLALGQAVDFDRWSALLGPVRYWTHQRQIEDNALGYPGGWSWALLCAHYLNQSEDTEVEQLLVGFFRYFAAWDDADVTLRFWPDPVLVSGQSYQVQEHDLFPVPTCTAPWANTAANVIPATFRVLKREFLRGANLASAGRWDQLFEMPVWDAGTVLSFPVCPKAGLEESMGWLRKNTLDLLLKLEKSGPYDIQPWPLEAHEDSIVLRIESEKELPRALIADFQKHYESWSKT